KAIALAPNQIEYYEVLGAFQLSAGQIPAAESVYKDAVRANPNSAQAHLALAQFYFAQRKFPESESELTTASNLDPKNVMIRILLGRVLVAKGKLQDAEQLYAQLKLAFPDDPQAYQALGMFYRSTGQKDKAVAEFKSLASEKPKDDSV